MPLIGSAGRTSAAAYVTDVPGGQNFDIIALLTVGDEVPLITSLTSTTIATDTTRKFAMTGIPDGMGVYRPTPDGNYYVFVNHEFGGTESSDISSTEVGKQIIGARVSLFVFDRDWKVIGGQNLITNIIDQGVSYTLNTTTGLYTANNAATLPGFGRFCSAFLASSGFVDAAGAAIPVFFSAEESGNTSRGWAIGQDGTAVPIDGLGRFSKENVIADKTTIAGKTVMLSTEDASDGELYMWIGNPNANATTFAEKNGFAAGLNGANGDLFVLRLTGVDFEGSLTTVGSPIGATWTPVDDSAVYDPTTGLPKATGADLSTWVNTAGRSTNFQRLEDLAPDPTTPGKYYFVTTGTTNIAGSTTVTTTNPANADNPYGRLYSFTLGGTAIAPTVQNFKLELVGGLGKGVSYDNITVTASGKVLLQEDATGFGSALISSENREAGIWEYDPVTGTVAQFLALNESAAGSNFNNPAAKGEWETSGIVTIGNQYLFDIQAHTVINAAGSTTVLGGKHIEGGQLVVATPVAPLSNRTPKSDFNSINTSPNGSLANNPGVNGKYVGDGYTDLLWRNKTTGANVVWYARNGNLAHNTRAPIEGIDFDVLRPVADRNWQLIGSADFNRDNQSDTLWWNQSTGATTVWLMNGKNFASGTLSTDTTFATGDFAQLGIGALVGPNWSIQAIGDFNGDTQSDLVLRNAVNGENVIWYLDGTINPNTNQLNFKSGNSTLANLVANVDYSVLPTLGDRNWDIAAAADFNGDQRTDLIWRNATTGENVIWFLNGGTSSSPASTTGFKVAGSSLSAVVEGQDYAVLLPVNDANWKLKGAADYDRDGNTDLFWQNEATGSTGFWFMNQINQSDRLGTRILSTSTLLNVGSSSSTSGWGSAGLA